MSRHILITAQGTGVNMWDTATPQPFGVAQLLAQRFPNLFFAQPLGNYPAAMFPMGSSVTDGVNEMIRQTTIVYPNNSVGLLGYSQGAMVVCQFIQWCYANNRTDILSRIVFVVVWGNPQRLAGFASGNVFAGWPMPANVDGLPSGGIAGPKCMAAAQLLPHLSRTPQLFWGDFVNTIGKGNDLYADAPWWNGAAAPSPGLYETQIFNLVQSASVNNLFAFVLDIMKLFGPELFEQVWSIFEAILNGGMFAAAGPTAAHYTYNTYPIYEYALQAGQATAPWGPV